MTKTNEIYKCKVCGNIIEVVGEAEGTLSCCGQFMQQMKENDTDGAREKHMPVVTKTSGGYRVEVGEVEHPMTEAHYIQWIELVTPDTVYRKQLTPSDSPVAEFATDAKEAYAREYCNLHGLWRSK